MVRLFTRCAVLLKLTSKTKRPLENGDFEDAFNNASHTSVLKSVKKRNVTAPKRRWIEILLRTIAFLSYFFLFKRNQGVFGLTFHKIATEKKNYTNACFSLGENNWHKKLPQRTALHLVSNVFSLPHQNWANVVIAVQFKNCCEFLEKLQWLLRRFVL